MPKLRSAVHAGKPRGRRAIAALAAALVATSLGAVCALAQKWPERSITLIVPFAAGGASDVSSRIMADVMSKHLGQSVIIENAAGAGGATGSLRGKNAQPRCKGDGEKGRPSGRDCGRVACTSSHRGTRTR